MIRLVISNQRGGVAKTTSATTLARLWADQGRKVLLIDTDPQGSVGMSLGLKAEKFLHHFVVYNHLFESCLVHAGPNIDVLCSSRETIQAEASLMGVPAREMSFALLFSKVDEPYDIVLIDVAPSITLMQTCAMVYAQRVLIPVSMDTLSLQGAGACLETARMMNELFRVNVRPAALLPVMVDRRFQHTAVMMKSLEDLSAKFGIPLLPAIRTDVTVSKCGRARQFLADYDPKCKAMEDYELAGNQLLELLSERASQNQSEHVQTVQA